MSLDIKKELELKKAKLKALREEKDRKKREKDPKELKDIANGSNAVKHQDVVHEKSMNQDLDAMLSSLGITPVSEMLSSVSSNGSDLNNIKEVSTTDSSGLSDCSKLNSTLTTGTATTTTATMSTMTTATATANADDKAFVLTKTALHAINILPKEVYSKNTQTDNSIFEREGPFAGQTTSNDFDDFWRIRKNEYNLNPGLEWEDEFAVAAYDGAQDDEPLMLDDALVPNTSLGHSFRGKLTPGLLSHGLPKVKDVPPAITLDDNGRGHGHGKGLDQIDDSHKNCKKTKNLIPEMSEEEKQKVLMSSNFRKFLNRTAPIIERALSEQLNIFTNYAETQEEETAEEILSSRILLNRTFYDEKLVKNRSISSLDWSPHYPELHLASYLNRKDAPHNTMDNGLCLVWNMKFAKKETPEYVFNCQSTVTSAIFPKFHQNLVLGGTYSGQIVLWDNREPKRTPVQRTLVSANAHTHPIYSMKLVGSHNAHNLITMSTDGTLCAWSLDMLAHPQEKMELNRQKSKAVSITCCDFNLFDVNNFIIGTEEGCAYSACRHGDKDGTIIKTFQDHHGPITGINFHKVRGEIEFPRLFLTSSFDWTVKLWSSEEHRCLFTFEGNCDYVMDVAWSPVHPAVFAAAYISGRIDVYNLNQTTEVPCATTIVDGSPALNKISWTNSGLRLTVGDFRGRIWVYDLAENFFLPKKEDWKKFAQVKQEFHNDMIYKDMVKSGKFK